MLISEEMPKDFESRHESPNIVAKLMGLDALSYQQKMALIHQDFVDAKRLSIDENRHQTKEFQDAVDVLSPNQHLFLKVLQEPSSMVPHHLYPPNETDHITVLKPSKALFSDKFPTSRNRNEKQVRKSCSVGLSSVAFTQQPSQIVVLKPTPGMIQDVMAALPSIPSSPVRLQRPNLFEVPRDDETQEAREVAMLPYGYTGDERSFTKSEAEFVGNLSDSRVMSLTFKQSWDDSIQNGVPCSSSSPSHESYMPESSVAKETKKRLSERWVLMASNDTCSEERHVKRSTSTLGEMLALSDTKGDQHHRVSTSCLNNNVDGIKNKSPRSLMRSKSLHVTSMASHQRSSHEALDQEARKMDGSMKKATKSSFRRKVASLFFQRSKKPCKGKTDESQPQDKVMSNHTETSMPCDNNIEYRRIEEVQSSDLQSTNKNLWLKLNEEPGQGFSPQQVPLSTLKPATLGTSSEIQDQTSPISVLESKFEVDAIDPNQLGKQQAFSIGRSNLIDKSPLIGSISRTLAHDDSYAQQNSSNSPKPPLLLGGSHEDEDWLILIQSLLSSVGVENESRLCSDLRRWHSPESPLNPLLREKYLHLVANEPSYEANQSQLRSNCWLVFDYVNGVLLELSDMGANSTKWVHEKRTEFALSRDLLTDKIWAKLKQSVLGSDWEAEVEGDDKGLVVEKAVRKELAGKGWENLMTLEIDIIGKEIEGKLLNELVEDFVGEWIATFHYAQPLFFYS